MLNGYKIIDADSHVIEPPAMWGQYLEPKFKDAELIGNPVIVIVGKSLADGKIEVRDRKSGSKSEVPIDEALSYLVGIFK